MERLPSFESMVWSWQENVVVTAEIEWLNELRAICLALPEAVETGGVGNPSFKVRDKIFAMRHQYDGRWSMWCKAPPGVQQGLVETDPKRFFVPPYVGHHGWVGVYLDVALDRDEITDLIEDSYRMTAPKRLSRLLNDGEKNRDDHTL
jgi:predicted DNA-binding protein (MmcQ/YjbR family)